MRTIFIVGGIVGIYLYMNHLAGLAQRVGYSAPWWASVKFGWELTGPNGPLGPPS